MGRPQQAKDALRSLPFEALSALVESEDAQWYSLQVGPRSEELKRLPEGRVNDLGPHLKDFAHTAAAVAQLDCVVTVDTSVAHLAGAMGRPVWVLSARPCDWRWEGEGEDSAWYPSVRVFKQERPGEWDAVTEKVKSELAALRFGTDVDVPDALH